jgi:hypothetical protein
LLVKPEFLPDIDWNKRFIVNPDRIDDFPYACKAESLKWTPSARLMEVSFDLDRFAEQVMEVNCWKAAPAMVDDMNVTLGCVNARDFGYNFMLVDVEGDSKAGRTVGPIQLVQSLMKSRYLGTINNHVHEPDAGYRWMIPLELHPPCTERVRLYREKPQLPDQKPDLTCLIHFKRQKDILNSREYLSKRAAEIAESQGPDSTRLLSVYGRLADSYAADNNPAAAQRYYGSALKIAVEKADCEVNGFLFVLAGLLPAHTTDAQIDEMAARQQWPDYLKAALRGAFYYKHDNLDRAVSEFDHAVKLRPTCSSFHTCRAYTLKAMGRYNEASADYKRALAVQNELPFLKENCRQRYSPLWSATSH